MNRKLGIISSCIIGTPSINALPLIKNAGFDAFFNGAIALNDVSQIKNESEKLGLLYESIHAPFKPYTSLNGMWTEGDEYLTVFEGMKTAIESAGKCNIPIVVMHLSSGWNPPNVSDLGISRYEALIEIAEKNNVILAFENLRKVGNVAHFADRFEKNDHVRFCYDCGHEHCYTNTVSWPDIFTDRIVYTHIHDNFGIQEKYQEHTDIHLLPFEGDIDCADMMRRLNKHNYQGSLTLEVNNERHQDMSAEDFLATCYERIKKISEM